MTTMTPITRIAPAGGWAGFAADMVVLDYDGRHRRRVVLTGVSGTRYLLDLAEAAHLRDGDGLLLAEGGVVQVIAKAEPLLEVRAGTPEGLLRLAWHIGNRHLAAQVFEDRILIRRDHVIAHMLEHQGARIREIEAPFDPEGGAYHGHQHSHDHAH
ncbi:MAG: urease accessory protein UreE [Phenylobacterium sp.]|uniref:urease accessory protein UreE n=1 Tax=Phenylobacterium sp. TaxID=1871053 RepID=UPI001A6022DA|nr:urease accessory protein UreE [Phenylobacterium sp.]MBL8771255.1 urease accessory protein UreE [Phenylobacterium sp.]